ncbi:MAG: tetratricopeptide repeat protein [Pseudanabaena sp. M046S1SP1A06QC]|nr:tetratricopeptide repeat protein [Pseudanabaena sp. M046S1SP1A06QC]
MPHRKQLLKLAHFLFFSCSLCLVGGGVTLSDVALGQVTEAETIEIKRVLKACLDDVDSSKNQEAIKSCQQALEKFKINGNRIGEAEAIDNLGITYYNLGQYQESIEFLQQSLAIKKQIGDQDGESNTLFDLGRAYYGIGQSEKAIEFFQQSLIIKRKLGKRKNESFILASMASVYDSLGKYQKAIEFYQQALVIIKQIGDRDNESVVLSNIRIVYESLKQPQKAIEFYQQSLEISKQIGDRSSELEWLIKLSDAYNSLREYQKVIEFSQQSLVIAREIKDRSSGGNARVGMVYLNLVEAYRKLGNNDKAIEYQLQYLEFTREIKDRITEGILLELLAKTYQEFGKYDKAIEYQLQRLAFVKEVKDRLALGQSLLELGRNYLLLGKYDKALEYQLQSLEIARDIKDRSMERNSLVILGLTYQNQLKYDKAIEYQLQSLEIARAMKDRSAESSLLRGLGEAYYYLSKYDRAIEFSLQSLAIATEIKDRSQQGKALGNLGKAYSVISKYDKAIEYQLQSLEISREIKDTNSEGDALGNLGIAYRRLGKYDKALEYHLQELAIFRKVKNRGGEGNALVSLGMVYSTLTKHDKAIEFYLQGLEINREISGDQVAPLIGLGNEYSTLGKYDKAIEYYLQCLKVTQELKDRINYGNAAQGLAIAYYKLGKHGREIEYFLQGLAIAREIKDRYGEATSLNNLGVAFENLNQPELAILFYKQSVNVTEAIRKDVSKLDQDIQKSYLATVEKTYRNLADLLLKQDRILEAQQVLDLLKVEELSEYLKTVRGNNETTKGTDLQKPEENIIALSNELAELQRLAIEDKLPPQQQPRLAFLTNNEIEQNKQFNAFLQVPVVQEEIQKLRRTQSAESVKIESYNRLRRNLGKLQNAALFYPLILEDRLELILIIANAPPIRKTINLKRTDLNQAIATFLSNLRNPNSVVKPDAQKFYNWLIQPFDKELQQANIQTIIYAPDEGLRYIPLAALYDGKQWLVERYRINNITAASLTDFTPRTASSIRVLAAASSAKHDVKVGDRLLSFSPLPATKLEVDNIATKINTTKLVDRAFTESALTGKLNTHNIIHLATHGHFEVGQPEQSFILLGDGNISTISDIGSWTLTNVSLVVLSACETAIGGQGSKGKGIEIFGLGYQIHNAGASAAIATLWKVSDGGTERLMDAFYTAIKTGKVSNTEALRQAQVAMITGNYEGLGDARGIVSIEARPRATASTVPAKISHPYYWGAFILIGNGM